MAYTKKSSLNWQIDTALKIETPSEFLPSKHERNKIRRASLIRSMEFFSGSRTPFKYQLVRCKIAKEKHKLGEQNKDSRVKENLYKRITQLEAQV